MSSGCEKDILRFETIPNRGLFEASCVQRNFPAVLRGANVHWPALDKWNPVNGGLEYLKGLAGDAKVQAMASSQGSTFYGAIGRHERIEAQFKDILNLASNTLGNGTNESSRMLDMEKESAAHPVSSQDGEGSHSTSNETELREGLNIYLAQAPILNRGEANASASLHKLLQDLSIPNCIDEEIVASMNLWMSVTGSRSSTHYDPFHNLLCPIVGSRRVTLWPPSSTPYLYPLALHGEASNHSAVDFAAPNYVQFPLFCEAEKTSFCVTILPGDALFIPEGWWHQVDADSVALAVNIWWPSLTSTTFGSHMDAYYARRIILSLVDAEKKRMLEKIVPYTVDYVSPSSATASPIAERRTATSDLPGGSLGDASARQWIAQGHADGSSSIEDEEAGGKEHARHVFGKLTKEEAEFLKALVLVSAHAYKAEPMAREQICRADEEEKSFGRNWETSSASGWSAEDDTVAQVLAALEPLRLLRILQVMAEKFPMSLRILILHGLSPPAAELLTTKLEEADSQLAHQQFSTDDRNAKDETFGNQEDFYKLFYSVFDDPQDAMAVLLAAKERFGSLALKVVLKGVIGADCSISTFP